MLDSARSARRRLVAASIFGGVVLSLAFAPAAQAAVSDWPDSIAYSDPRGVAFDADRDLLYVADRADGAIYSVDEDGNEEAVAFTWGSTMTVAVLTDGDLLFTQDSDATIYRIDSSELGGPSALVLGPSDIGSRVTIEHTATSPFVYGLAVAPDGTIYYGQYNNGRGVYALEGGVATLIFPTSSAIMALGVTPSGDLFGVDSGATTYRVTAAALAAGGAVNPSFGTSPGTVSGIAYFADSSSYYYSDMSRVTKVELVPSLVVGTPTISGTAAVGSTLTATPGQWSAETAFAYQWLRNGVEIAGATSATYALVAADQGAVMSVSVTGTNSLTAPASQSVTASPTVAVAAATATTPADAAAPAALAATGAEVLPLGAAAGALLAFGVLGLVQARRRGARV